MSRDFVKILTAKCKVRCIFRPNRMIAIHIYYGIIIYILHFWDIMV